MTISSEGKLAELIFQSTALRCLRLLLLLLLALEAVLPLASTSDAALAPTSTTNTASNSLTLLLLKLLVFHAILLLEKRWNLLVIVPSENLSTTISKLSYSARGHCKRVLLHLHLLLRVLGLGVRLREFAGLLRLTLRLLSLQFLVRHRLRNGLLRLQLLLHLHWLLLHLLFH